MLRTSIFIVVCLMSVSVQGQSRLCDIAGSWSNRVGISTTWTFQGRGSTFTATESGGCNATGTATLAGRRLTVNWSCPAGFSGIYAWTLDDSCTSGKGQVKHLGPKLKGRVEDSRITKIAPKRPESTVDRCDIAVRRARLSKKVDELAALGQRMQAYIQRPLAKPYEPELPEMCIQGDTAVIKYGGFWRSLSDTTANLNGLIGFFTGQAAALGFETLSSEFFGTKLDDKLKDQASAVMTLSEMARGQILKGTERKIDYEQGMKEYLKLRAAQKEAQAVREALRRHHICAVKIGVPAFYRQFHQVTSELARLEDDARACGDSLGPIDSLVRLRRLYRWHNQGAFCDRRDPECGRGGFVDRHGWIEKNYSSNHRSPPSLQQVTCN